MAYWRQASNAVIYAFTNRLQPGYKDVLKMYLSKNLGFSFSTAQSHIGLVDFFSSLVGKLSEFHLKSGNLRQIFFDQDADYFYGLVVTVKPQKRFASLVKNGQGVKVKITDLKDLEKIAEFNFLIISKSNGFGLYQWHHGSCTPSNFSNRMLSMYRHELEVNKALELKALPSDAPTKQEKAIRSKYRHGLQFQIIIQSRDIAKVLAAYRKITSFRYEISAVQAHITDAVPLQGLVSKATHFVRFDTSVGSNRIIEGIKNMIPRVNPKSVKIEALDDDDEPISVKIIDIPANFGQLEYDDFIAGLHTLRFDDLKSCKLFVDLRSKCDKEYAHVFSKKSAV